MVSFPIQRLVQDYLQYPANTTAIETVDVRPRVTGFLKEMHYTPDARVDKGALLFSIDERPYRDALDNAKARLATNQALLLSADYNLRRLKGLATQHQAAGQEVVDAQSRYDQVRAQIAQATADVAMAQLNFEWCRVTAPIHGRVSRNLVDVGNIVTADQTIVARMVNDDILYAYLNVSERDVLTLMDQLRREALADGRPPVTSLVGTPALLGLMIETGYPHQGKIDYTAPALDEATGTLQVRAEFPNADGVLIAGVFGRVRLPVGKPHPALLISEEAIASLQGRRYVLVVSEAGIVEHRPIETGSLHEGLRAVTAGLGPRDRVIVAGLQRARAGETVTPKEVPMPQPPPASAPASRPESAEARS